MEKPSKESKYVYKGRILSLRIDKFVFENGAERLREIVEHPGAAAAVPVLPDGRIILVRQYREAAESELLEIPAGKIEPGEPAAQCAGRELEEETGYRADRIEKLCEFLPSPGYSNERITIFLAEGLKSAGPARISPEIIRTVKIKKHEALSMLRDGIIKDGKTIAGLLFAFYST